MVHNARVHLPAGSDTRRGMKGRLREPISGLTHLVGGLLALVALVVLLTKAAGRVDQLVAFGIFGLSLVALYGASALYHLLPVSPPATARLRRLDHMTIFILIAGTYTPICVLALDGGWRVGLLGLIWTLAIFRAIPPGGIAWILGGGLVYSAGALIYGLRRPNLVPGIFGFHELWHLFVMAGSACHFWVMLRYIAPIS